MLRIATIGTSVISDNFIEAVNTSDRATYVGTLSRDAERATSFTRDHGGTTPFTSMDELVGSDEVDAVYIATPNAVHRSQALAAIEHGKHVLVEKPFASNLAEATRVFDAAERAGVVALEAMRPLHDPAFEAVRAVLPRLGVIRRANIRFGKYSSRYDTILSGTPSNMFDCTMSTGALMDMGVYAVEAMVALFGVPHAIAYAPILLDENTRELTHGPIDGAGSALCSYPGMVVELAYSKITNDDLPVQIEGELATLTLDSISVPSEATVAFRGRAERGSAKVMRSQTGGHTETLELPRTDNTMIYELEDFVAAVAATCAGTPVPEAPAGPFGTVGHFRTMTCETLRVMDEARRQGGIVFPADGE